MKMSGHKFVTHLFRRHTHQRRTCIRYAAGVSPTAKQWSEGAMAAAVAAKKDEPDPGSLRCRVYSQNHQFMFVLLLNHVPLARMNSLFFRILSLHIKRLKHIYATSYYHFSPLLSLCVSSLLMLFYICGEKCFRLRPAIVWHSSLKTTQ